MNMIMKTFFVLASCLALASVAPGAEEQNKPAPKKKAAPAHAAQGSQHAVAPTGHPTGHPAQHAQHAFVPAGHPSQHAITPAAEWLVDNFYIVEEQLREIRDDLPVGFYRKLPKLASGHLQGYPRVFGVAWAFVAHTDSRFEPEVLRCFVTAYQRVQPLTIGELWAVPISLRIVMVENLRRLSVRIVGSQMAREGADAFVDELAP